MKFSAKINRWIKQNFSPVAYIIGLVVLFFMFGYALPRIFDSENYYPDPYSNTLEFQRKRWFKPDETIKLEWKKLNTNQEGWCAKSSRGFWYVFVRDIPDRPDEY